MTAAVIPEHTEPTHKHRRPRTGAGARFNADHIGVYRFVNIGVLVTALAAVLISWQGLIYVAAWMELDVYWRWLLPLAIDVPIVVFTLATLNRKSRGESFLFLAITAYLMTAISSFANFLHVADARPLDTMPGIVGASLAALAPMLVLLTTEALGMIATKPPAENSPRRKHLRTVEELKIATKELRATARALKAAEAERDQAREAATALAQPLRITVPERQMDDIDWAHEAPPAITVPGLWPQEIAPGIQPQPRLATRVGGA